MNSCGLSSMKIWKMMAGRFMVEIKTHIRSAVLWWIPPGQKALVLHFYAKSSKRLVYLARPYKITVPKLCTYHCTLGKPLSMAHNNYLPNNQFNIFRNFLFCLSWYSLLDTTDEFGSKKGHRSPQIKNIEDRCYKIYG